MLKKLSISLFLLILFNSQSFSKNLNEEAIQILSDYIKINTTNPPGNEIKTASFLKRILDKEGIENKVFKFGNNRANLYARIKGTGEKKPIIFLHHMDVVPAENKYWSDNPFSGKVSKGNIYGRGSVDVKGKGIVDLMTLIYFHRNKIPLKRDIIFLAVSDEEVASSGSKWMIKNKSELLKNAEYLFDEGSSVISDEKGNTLYYSLSIGEKAPLWLTLTFFGEPGHASVPSKNSSVNKAINAAKKILDYKNQFKVLPGIEESIKMLLTEEKIKTSKYFKNNYQESLKNEEFLNEISNNSEINAMISNTISITGLKGSDKINTIPNEASISLDCRLLPGTNKYEFINELKKIVNDDSLKIEIEEYINTKYSSTSTEFIKVLEKLANKEKKGIKVIPTILTSSTDSSFYRDLGINVYGFESYKLKDSEVNTAHGNDERISINGIKYGIDLLIKIVKELNN